MLKTKPVKSSGNIELALFLLREKLRSFRYDEKSIFEKGFNPFTIGVDYLPILEYKLRDKTALSVLTSLFILGSKLSRESAEAVFNSKEIDMLVSAGFLNNKLARDSIVSAVRISPYKGFYFLSDFTFRTFPGCRFGEGRHEFNCAYPPGPDSIMLADSLVGVKFDSTLDLCTGSGIQAILASRNSARVTGVDNNPRAVQFANMNLVLNDIKNVEFTLGDLYGPVKSEKFDYVIANPPFVMLPERDQAYRDGGMHGDEVFNRIIARLPAHLKKGGYCQIVTFLGEFSDRSLPRDFEKWTRDNNLDSMLMVLGEFGDVEFARGQCRNLLDNFEKYGKKTVEFMEHLENVKFKKAAYCLMAIKNNSARSYKRYSPDILKLVRPIDIISKHYCGKGALE